MVVGADITVITLDMEDIMVILTTDTGDIMDTEVMVVMDITETEIMMKEPDVRHPIIQAPTVLEEPEAQILLRV